MRNTITCLSLKEYWIYVDQVQVNAKVTIYEGQSCYSANKKKDFNSLNPDCDKSLGLFAFLV